MPYLASALNHSDHTTGPQIGMRCCSILVAQSLPLTSTLSTAFNTRVDVHGHGDELRGDNASFADLPTYKEDFARARACRLALARLGSEVRQETMRFDWSECYSAYCRQNRKWLCEEYADSFSMGDGTFDRPYQCEHVRAVVQYVRGGDQGAGGEGDEEGLDGIAETIRLRGLLGMSVSVERLHVTYGAQDNSYGRRQCTDTN